jgi:polyisoprenoid-binding protein YceI
VKKTWLWNVSLGVGLLAIGGQVAIGQKPLTLAVDAKESHVVIEVGKSGLFSVAGHAHEVVAPVVSGQIALVPADWPRSTVALEFRADALRVSGKGEPPADVPTVQGVMLSDRVLDVAHFPAVTFRSRRVVVTPQGAGALNVVVDGDVTLHGKTRPLTVQAVATLENGHLTARGSFRLKQTDFGMVPVTAGGGTIKVQDEVNIQFTLVARAAG